MKKLSLLIALVLTPMFYSCEEDELYITPEYLDTLDTIDTEEKLQQVLNNAYLNITSVNAFGGQALMIADLLSEHMFVTTQSSSFLITSNFQYNAMTNEFSAYGTMYTTIMYCNMVINNSLVPPSDNVNRIKAEAKILRAIAYFYLVNSYSATPSSGMNQEYGVALVTGEYDLSIQPSRATVAEVYAQIIQDLEDGVAGAADAPGSKNILSKTAAKLMLAKVYLTRRAAGDAQLALNYATDVVNNSPSVFAPITADKYVDYFNHLSDDLTENQPETIWELDLNFNNNAATGIGSNFSLPSYYQYNGTRKTFLFTQDFYNSFADTDVRKNLFTTQQVPNTDSPTGLWTTKHVRATQTGNFFRDIKILRFADAQLSRIEALYLLGDHATALAELNAFAQSRGGSTYSGADLLNDILTERYKEFFAEGYRFYDLKRNQMPIVRTSNCSVCSLPANDLKFVFPISQGTLNFNSSMTQYPGY